jgi:hypothetical protein
VRIHGIDTLAGMIITTRGLGECVSGVILYDNLEHLGSKGAYLKQKMRDKLIEPSGRAERTASPS